MQVRFEKKETVERFVTALYERGAYSPNAPLQNVCMVCGFTIDADMASGAYIQANGECVPVHLASALRFCPICGSRFDKESEFGLYPEEIDPEAEYDFAELKTQELSEREHLELIGRELYVKIMDRPETVESCF